MEDIDNYKKYSIFIPEGLLKRSKSLIEDEHSEETINDFLIKSFESYLDQIEENKKKKIKKSNIADEMDQRSGGPPIHSGPGAEGGTSLDWTAPEWDEMMAADHDAMQESLEWNLFHSATKLKQREKKFVKTLEFGNSIYRDDIGEYYPEEIDPFDWTKSEKKERLPLMQHLPPPRTYPAIFILYHLMDLLGHRGDDHVDAQFFEYNILSSAGFINSVCTRWDKKSKSQFKEAAGFPVSPHIKKSSKNKFLIPNRLHLIVNKYIAYTHKTYSITKKGTELVALLEGIKLSYPHSKELTDKYFNYIKKNEINSYLMFKLLVESLSEPTSKDDLLKKYEEALSKEFGVLSGDDTFKRLRVPTPYGGHTIDIITSSMIGKAREWGLVEKKMVKRKYLLTENINFDLFK